MNTLIKINIRKGKLTKTNEPQTHHKRGRPIGSKDKNIQKMKGVNIQDSKIRVYTF